MRTTVMTLIASALLALLLVFAFATTSKVPAFMQGQRINWNTIRTVSRALATCQVVGNPLLNEITTPVAKTAWQSLKKLDLSRVRFAAWFPYPQWSIPEPDPPKWSEDGTRCESTSWDFTGLMSQLGPFLKNVRSTVFEISTLPVWFFSSYGDNAYNHSVANNTVFWPYTSIGRWRANTSQLAGDYWGRIASYLLMGSMVDECGQTHSGGPAYLLQAAKTGIPVVWEVGNEVIGEWRGATASQYVATFDSVVTAIHRAVPSKYHHLIQFQGLALGQHGQWDWWSAFLDPSNHVPEARDSLQWASCHCYAGPRSRTNNDTWEWDLFETADEFVWELEQVFELRNRLQPNKSMRTRISTDELGTILPNDNAFVSAPISNLYWVASGSLYSYYYATLSAIGVDNIGESQLAGVPVLKEYGIPTPQYPSVSMLNWTTGTGNARFYALQLIKDEFSPTPVGPTNEPPEQIIHPPAALPPRQQMCAANWDRDYLLHQNKFVNLSCVSGHIDEIQLARMAYTVGGCANDFGLKSANCSDDGGVILNLVQEICLGRASCKINMSDLTPLVPACVKMQLPSRLVVKATCSGFDGGIASPSAYPADRVFVQARTQQQTSSSSSSTHNNKKKQMLGRIFQSHNNNNDNNNNQTTVKKLLVINKNNDYAPLEVEEDLNGAEMKMLWQNQPATVSTIVINSTQLVVVLPPFATAVIKLKK